MRFVDTTTIVPVCFLIRYLLVLHCCVLSSAFAPLGRRVFLSNSVFGGGAVIMSTENPAPSSSSQLRIALLGSGIFATTSHAPVLKKHPSVFLTQAVWSRRPESSQKLAESLNAQSYSGEEGLQQVLQRDDIDAVILALPLDVQPDYVRKALQSGKHVLSEKPVAATVSEAKALIKDYRALDQQPQWSVAENFRYEPGILRAADAVKNSIGTPRLVSLTVRSPFTPDNKYLNTPWRSSPSWYGGLFIDAMVHTAAALRSILGVEVQTVSALTTSRADHVPSVDTMVGHVTWESGVQGAIAVTYACTSMKFELEVTGSDGVMLLQRRQDGPGYRISVNGKEETFGFGGIDGEFLGFANACRGLEEDRNSPEEALRDLAFVEALLDSGKENGAFKTV